MKGGDLVVREYVVAFFDLLGQSKELRKLRNIPSSKEEVVQFTEQLKRSFGPVLDLREVLKTFFHSYANAILDKDLVEQLPVAAQETYKRSLEIQLKIQQFCDTMMAFAPIEDTDGFIAMRSVHAVLAAAATLQLIGLSGGNPLRGGIDVGVCVELGDEDLYGPAVLKAYELERDEADWPRIVVGGPLLQRLEDQVKHDSCVSSEDAVRRAIQKARAENARRLIWMDDIDGAQMIDFLGDAMLPGYVQSELTTLIGAAYDYVLGEHEKFRDAQDSKHERRYARLLGYFRARPNAFEAAGLRAP
jgi:hypothetical protein